jgi:hypothetical protein
LTSPRPVEPLEAKLRHARSAFVESMIALSAFVETTQESIQGTAKGVEKVRELFAAVQIGEPLPVDPSEDTMTLELSDDQIDLIVTAMEGYGGKVARFPTMLIEMALIYLIALFDAYVADVFRAVLISRPEMLRSHRQLTYEVILSFEDRGSLIDAMAAREINDIAYKSLSEQVRYYAERFGVDLRSSDKVSVDELVEVTARRNLLVHNAGIVNSVYLDTVPVASVSLGDRLVVDESYWRYAKNGIFAAVRVIDVELRNKFAPPITNGSTP